jgi:uncharacterized RDD family membrane protein YckC
MHNASLARRLGAILYDSLLVLALMILATLAFIAVRGGESVESGDGSFRITLLAIAYLFYVGFWSRYGRTLGMQSWRLQLETADSKKPDIARASLRFFAGVLSLIPLGLGFWWQLWDKDGLTWHDRLSGTRLRNYPNPPAAKKIPPKMGAD